MESNGSSCCGARNFRFAARSRNFDRCHSLGSLPPPPAALPSLPNSTTSVCAIILPRTVPVVNVASGRFRRFGKIQGKISIAFVQFFLTFILCLGKMDLVWCTLPQNWVSQRFMITGVLPGYAFCASWRVALNGPAGLFRSVFMLNFTWGSCAHPFDAYF